MRTRATRLGSFRETGDFKDHRLEVQEWNAQTKQWETIFSIVRAEPFTAQIIHDENEPHEQEEC